MNIINSIIVSLIGYYFFLQMKFNNDEEYRTFLQKCAATALNSKLIHQEKEFFSKIAVDAVLLLDELLPLNMIGIKKVQGGGLQVIFLVLAW